ncbi:MAG: Hpt domain-containing protein [Treponema sp.]|nr:Hpt domain-containing protein [Treponema sp.]
MSENIIYINAEDGLKRVMNNIKLFSKLLTKFKEDPTYNSIFDALTEGDMAKAQIAAHTFKGLTANLSLTEMYKQCVELEAQIKAGSVKNEHLELVKTVYDRTLIEVDKVITQYA